MANTFEFDTTPLEQAVDSPDTFQDAFETPPCFATPIRTAVFSSGQTFADMNVIERKASFESCQNYRGKKGQEIRTNTGTSNKCDGGDEVQQLLKAQCKLRDLSLRNQKLEALLRKAAAAAAAASQDQFRFEHLVQRNAFLEFTLGDNEGQKERLRKYAHEIEEVQASEKRHNTHSRSTQTSEQVKSTLERALQNEQQKNKELENTVQTLRKETETAGKTRGYVQQRMSDLKDSVKLLEQEKAGWEFEAKKLLKVSQRNQFLEVLYRSGSVFDKAVLDMLNDKDDQIQALNEKLKARWTDDQALVIPDGQTMRRTNQVLQTPSQSAEPGVVLGAPIPELEGVTASGDPDQSEQILKNPTSHTSKPITDQHGMQMAAAMRDAAQNNEQSSSPSEREEGAIFEEGAEAQVIGSRSESFSNKTDESVNYKRKYSFSGLSTFSSPPKHTTSTQIISSTDLSNSHSLVGQYLSSSTAPTDSTPATDMSGNFAIEFCDTAIPKNFASVSQKLQADEQIESQNDGSPEQEPETPTRTRTQKRNAERRRAKQRHQQMDGHGEMGQHNMGDPVGNP